MEDRGCVAALAELFSLADADDASLKVEALNRWPPNFQDWASRISLFEECENASTVVCDACGLDHVEEVVVAQGDASEPARHFIMCPDAGRVLVPAERLKRLAVDLNRLASIVSESVGAAGGVSTALPGRLWRVGRLRIGADVRSLFIARGLSWDDGQRLFEDPGLAAAGQPILLTFREEVGAAGIPFLNLRNVLSFTEEGLVFDRLSLEALQARRRAPTEGDLETFPTPVGVEWDDAWIAIGEHEMRIRVRAVEKILKYAAIGFLDGRTKKQPDAKWEVMRVLGSRLGVLREDDSDLSRGARANLKRYISDIRSRIKDLFVTIDGDPITFQDDRTYRSRFHIGTEEPFTIHSPGRFGWSDVTIAESQSVDEIDVVVRGEIHRLPLCYIGLADLGGTRNAAGLRMEQLFREGGEIRELPTDRGMQELGGSLCTLLGLDEPAFQFAPVSGRLSDSEPGRWLPNFKVGPRRRSSITERVP